MCRKKLKKNNITAQVYWYSIIMFVAKRLGLRGGLIGGTWYLYGEKRYPTSIVMTSDPCTGDINKCKDKLIRACEEGYLGKVLGFYESCGTTLELNGADFVAACANGHDHIVEYLLEQDDFSERMGESLKVACENGHTKVVKLLCNNKKFEALACKK